MEKVVRLEFSLWEQVWYPVVFLYIMAYFFQGGTGARCGASLKLIGCF
jgi:hypothetical protein